MKTVPNKTRLGFLALGLGALFLFILVRLPSSTEAQGDEGFGVHTLRGSYGFKAEGVIYLPDPDTEETMPLPFNMLGQLVADGEGNIVRGSRTLNFGGRVEADTVTGTYSVNSDGTGSLLLDASQDDEQVTAEEFDCFFTPAGDQFECTITRIVETNLDSSQEFPAVALATGLQQTTDIPEPIAAGPPGELLWKLEFGGNFPGYVIGPRSAVIADEVVYFGGFDGNFYSVDKNTGQEKWRFETGGDTIATSPTVVDGVAYFGSMDHNLYAVDLASGEEVWRFETGSAVRSSPAVAGEAVYFGSNDGHLYAVDVETGQEKWRFETDGQVLSSPTVLDGIVYFGSGDDRFYAVDMASGQEKWNFKTGLSVREGWGVVSSPTIVDGVVYFGSDDRYLNALDLETGQPKWRFQTLGINPSSPAVADGVAYIGSTDNYLYAVDIGSGQEQWKFETKREVTSSPFVAEGVVYFGSDDGYLYAVDVETGQELWSFETEGAVSGSPLVVDGVVYFLSRDGNFYAVRAG